VLLPRQQAKLARGAKDREHAMSQTPNTAIAVIDIGKNSFHHRSSWRGRTSRSMPRRSMSRQRHGQGEPVRTRAPPSRWRRAVSAGIAALTEHAPFAMTAGIALCQQQFDVARPISCPTHADFRSGPMAASIPAQSPVTAGGRFARHLFG
jgi:hypothetical protein